MAAFTTVDDSEAYFQAKAYTGDGGTNAITFDGTTDMQPDFVWIKNREQGDSHCLFDSVRGATKVIHSDTDDAEATDTDTLTAFGSDGFTVGADVKVNTSGEDYMSWNWKESATAGFDIVSYTGNDTARTISHSLSAVPHFIWIELLAAAHHSVVYHHRNTSAPETDYLVMNTTAATADLASIFNDTAPTSSVFSVGTAEQTNDDGSALIAYAFTGKQGFSKFGTYTGSGNSDGPFVYTGFRPAWILCKCNSASSSEWRIWNNKMDTFNPVDNVLDASDNGAEDLTAEDVDFCANGFKWRASGLKNNDSGETYVYAAFAEAPFVNSKGVPGNAR